MNITTKELQGMLLTARRLVAVGSVWKHKKGGVYLIIGHGFDTELARINVHYHRIGGPNYDEGKEVGIIFDRPLFQWTPERFQEINVFRSFPGPERESEVGG